MEQFPLYVTDAAKIAGLQPWTVRKKARNGEIVATKIHGDWRFSRRDLDSYLEMTRDKGANLPLRELIQKGIVR